MKVEFEDRALAHLQVVLNQKLRRNESWLFIWVDDSAIGNGRSAIWVHPAIPIFIKFYGSKMPRINPAWIDALIRSANSNAGLLLMPEPVQEATVVSA